MVGPPGSLAPASTEAHTSQGLVWLGRPRRLGQGQAAGARGVEGGVNATVTGAALGERVLLWLQWVQGVEPAIIAVAAGCVAGEGIAAGMTGVLRLSLEGRRSVSFLDSGWGGGGQTSFSGSSLPLSVNPGAGQLRTLAPPLTGLAILGN